MPTLNIDNSDLVKYTRKLEKLNKSALPIAVRNSLNRAAKSMKVGDKFIEKEFKDNFIIRRPSFIKSHTGFQKAPFSEWNIDRMESSAGILKGKSKSGDSLKLQEEGGTINNRFVPTRYTRIGENKEGKQSAKYYFNKYKNRPNGHVIRNKRITVIKSKRNLLVVNRNKEWKTLYSLVPNVKIRKQPFVQRAGWIAGRDLNEYYIDEVKKRIVRLNKNYY